MLPEDTDWFANDGNEEITHDWTNALQRGVDCEATNESTAAFPSPTGTTLTWGGGKFLVYHDNNGIANGAKEAVESVKFDWQNRIIVVLGGGAYTAATKLPGGGLWNGAASMNFDASTFNSWSVYYTASGATDGAPPGGSANYLTLAANVYLFADETDAYKLKMRNQTGAAIYPWMLFWVSDQYPTRT